MTRWSAVAVLLGSALLTTPGHTQEGEGRLESDGRGLRTATFDTISGTVRVHLPEEMAAGDTISGTVVAEPAGETERKREKNLGTLSGYVLEVEDEREEVGEGRLRLSLPEATASDAVTLVLREVRRGKPGREVGRVELPVQGVTETVGDFLLPDLAQTGHPLVVRGRFDGDLSTTGLRVGGTDALPLAESPRAAIFRSPAEIVGKAPVTLSEQGETVLEGEIRNVAVTLSAPRLDLRKGESTTLSTVVSGLEDLEEEIPLSLEVWPAAVVSVEGGHRHDLVIRPEEVDDATGTYATSLGVTGRTAGRWKAKATVETPAPGERFVLVLEGDPMGRVRSVSGGRAGDRKVSFQAGLDLKRPFYDWIRASFSGGGVRHDGSIVAVDAAGAEREVREFHGAFIESVTFPALDASAKEPAYLRIKIDAEEIRYEDGSGEVAGKLAPAGKAWLSSDFRMEIGDRELHHGCSIETFTWKMDLRRGVSMKIYTSDVAGWEGWHRAFVGPMRSAEGALDGRLVFLGPDRSSELATIELHDATMSSLEVGPPTGETRSITIELRGSRVSWVH